MHWKIFSIFLICCDVFVAGGEPVLLSGGIHSFPFKLGLPLGLPSTFLGKHGWVQYFCKAALREETGLTHKNQQVFIIMNPIDLNLEPPILAVRFFYTHFCKVKWRWFFNTTIRPFFLHFLKRKSFFNLGLPLVRSLLKTFSEVLRRNFPHFLIPLYAIFISSI